MQLGLVKYTACSPQKGGSETMFSWQILKTHVFLDFGG